MRDARLRTFLWTFQPGKKNFEGHSCVLSERPSITLKQHGARPARRAHGIPDASRARHAGGSSRDRQRAETGGYPSSACQ